MLCALEPVKCCSRLPNWSGSTTRRSTATPVWVRARAAFSPGDAGALDDVELGEGGQQRRRVGGRGDDVEVLDRVGQAPRGAGQLDAVATAGCARSASTIASPISSALLSSTLRRRAPRRRRPRTPRAPPPRTSAPKPRTSRSFCGLGRRAQRLERVDAELVVELARALGPEPGQAREVDEAGRELRRAASRPPGSCPSRAAPRSSPRACLPMPGSSVTLPSRVMAATERGASRTDLAALR